jgi:hypothetical protein
MIQYPCPVCLSSRQYNEAPCDQCGWQPDDVRAARDLPPLDAAQRTRRVRSIWWAFVIAPPVAPILMSLVIFSMLFWPGETQKTLTPTGFIVYPLFTLLLGTLISYFVAAVISLPMVFALERREMLSGFVISLIAIASWWMFVAGCCLLLLLLQPQSAGATIRFGLAVSVFFSPFVWASAITFAWIVHSGSNGMSLLSIMVALTLLALMFAGSAPALRAFIFENT